MSRFINQRVVSRGGMATIYRAEDTENGGTVALKEVLESAGFSETLRKQLQKRLEREAKTLARLDHPNIVKYFGTAQQDGHVYIVTEFLSGTTLEQEIVSGRIVGKRDLVVSAFQQICKGMEYAQLRGVVHRDIKPANIFLCGGHVKLIDFGIARLMDGVSMTGDEQILGTPHYMSPEQTLGARAVDSRGDVFSTGVCLYHAATGELPFNGRGREEVTNAIRTQPMPRGTLWPEIEPIVERALQKDPKDRWQSFEEFERALGAIANGSVVVPAVSAPASAPMPPVAPPAAPESLMSPPPMPFPPAPVQRVPDQLPMTPLSQPFDAFPSAPAPAAPTGESQVWRYALAGGLAFLAVFFLIMGPFGAFLAVGSVGGAVALVLSARLSTSPADAGQGVSGPTPMSMDATPYAPPPPAFAPLPRQAPGGRRVCYSVNGMSMVSKPSDTGIFVVGRSESAHIRIPSDTRVSGDHARVAVMPDGSISYEDHSSNGSFMGGQRIGAISLRPGGEVRLGSTILRFDSVT